MIKNPLIKMDPISQYNDLILNIKLTKSNLKIIKKILNLYIKNVDKFFKKTIKILIKNFYNIKKLKTLTF